MAINWEKKLINAIIDKKLIINKVDEYKYKQYKFYIDDTEFLINCWKIFDKDSIKISDNVIFKQKEYWVYGVYQIPNEIGDIVLLLDDDIKEILGIINSLEIN